MTDNAPITIIRRIAARPETVFAYFTDSARYRRWMGVDAELDARPGGIYRVDTPNGGVARGEFIEVDAPKRIVFSWGWEGNAQVPPGSSTVEVTLEPDGDGTRVTLVHSGLPVEAVDLHAAGWERYASRLVLAAEGGDPGPDEA